MAKPHFNYVKTFGERLIRLADLFVKAVLFLVLPSLVLVLMLTYTLGQNFVSNLLFTLGLVYLTGGFVLLGIKMWELYDNKFILFKRGQWKSQPIMKRIFYKVCIPKGFNKKPEDLIGLYCDMRNLIGGLRTRHEMYNLGKWYYDWVFDIIIKGGKAEMYMSFNLKRKDFVLKTFKARFPEIKLVETYDPYEKWPKKWVIGKTKLGPFSDLHAFDFATANNGPFPICEPNDVFGNPMGEFLEALCEFHPQETMTVLQYVFRPFPTDPFDEKWRKELAEFKKGMLERSVVFNMKDVDGSEKVGATGDLVTDTQKKIINDCENKLNQSHFRAHCKMMVFFPKGKSFLGTLAEKLFKAYAGQIGGDVNSIVKDWYTSTDRFFFKAEGSIIDDGFIGPFMDRFYHPKETAYRKVLQYESLPDRDPDVSHDSMTFVISINSACSLFHWPNFSIFPEEFENKNTPQIPPINIERVHNLEPIRTDVSNLDKLKSLKLQ